MSRRAKRPSLAALLSILQPGLGQLYLREWSRAVTWIGLWAVTLAVAVRVVPLEFGTWEAAAALLGFFAVADVPTWVVLSMLSVAVCSAIDAYLFGRHGDRRPGSEAPRCPNCGRELDRSLEFCHWCTVELECPGDVTGGK